MRVVSVAQMRAIEQEADANRLSYDQMMENAGRGLADEIFKLPFGREKTKALGLVGPGNNGGDTLIALAHLTQAGWRARAYLIKRKKDALVKRLLDVGGEAVMSGEDPNFDQLAACIKDADVLLDGVLGTGIKLPLKEEIASILGKAKSIISTLDEPPFVAAVDCPSGVDCETGESASETIRADMTITMAVVKRGLLKLPAFEQVGELKVVDIGLPPKLSSLKDLRVEAADEGMVVGMLPVRPLDAHKGTFGSALIAAGSVNYTGAALLAGKAAYRVGAGLVTLAVPAPLHSTLAGQFPEATWILLPHEMGVIARDAAEVLADNLERATALLIGPGFGLEDTTKEFIEKILTGILAPKKTTAHIGFVHEKREGEQDSRSELPPVIFDADGLKLLARIKEWQKLLPAPAVLTPHPGEMAVLTGLKKEDIQKNREEIASQYAQKWGHVVVLKGAFTVIAAPDGLLTLIPVASPALARAGTGDVLAGLIVGLRAQGLEAYEAAVAGAWIHPRAGLYAADDLGTSASVMAGDVLNSVSDVLSDLL
jgi:hydroxyethylthiazole kinase-like uncharacterized protein yjeF